VSPLQDALRALRNGELVLLYDADGREGETDLVVASEFATPDALRLLRSDGGGLVCTVVAPEHHRKLGLPFLADLLREQSAANPVLAEMQANDLRYDPSKSSFGITVNHRRTFTGIPDADRSLTIRELAGFLGTVDGLDAGSARKAFGASFRTPGHCILLNAAADGLAARQGHTELSLELMRQAGLVPSATICEMLDPASGRALSKKDAQAYAQAHGLVFLTGQDVLDAWQANAAPAAPATRPTRAEPRVLA
jgi:3,4-dihydroxy 2-butanone 4-phosphate synthase